MPPTGTLVLHAHGGPNPGAPTAERAAEDTERLRVIFLQYVGKAARTLLHGQSWGAGVAAKAAEMFTAATSGEEPYDGVPLSSGILAGGSRSYDFRTDLRVVYQYLCNNHPRVGETACALNLGLPAGTTMSPSNLTARVNECLALDEAAADRTPAQQARVETIEEVIKIPASAIQSNLNWATFHFQDVTGRRTGGPSRHRRRSARGCPRARGRSTVNNVTFARISLARSSRGLHS